MRGFIESPLERMAIGRDTYLEGLSRLAHQKCHDGSNVEFEVEKEKD